MIYKGFNIVDSFGRGGKAVRGFSKTASIQLQKDNPHMPGYYQLLGQFKYTVGDSESHGKAIAKAKMRADELLTTRDSGKGAE